MATKNLSSLTQLRFLQVGENFEIPQLNSTMRNLTVLRSSDCGVLVMGEMRDDEASSWKRDTGRICATVLVEPSGILNKITANGDGTFMIKTETGEDVAFEGVRKGRKPSAKQIIWPKGNFTLKEISEKMDIPYATVAVAFGKEKEKFEKVGNKTHVGKGKPASIWKFKG